jgi:hypothetical protein
MADSTGTIDVNALIQQALGAGQPTVGGTAAGIWDMIRGLNGTDLNNARTAANAADPFASQRGQYQTQLQGLLTNPNSFQMDPGTQFAENQALQAVSRHGNAMFGTTRSGNTAQALEQTAAGYGAQAYNQRITQLMQMSGANNMFGPSEAGRIMAGGYANQNASLAGGLQGGINGILSAILGKGGSNVGDIGSILSQLFSANTPTDTTGFTTGQNSFGDILSSTGGSTSPTMDQLTQMFSGDNSFSGLWGNIGDTSGITPTDFSGGSSGGGMDFSGLWGGIGGP